MLTPTTPNANIKSMKKLTKSLIIAATLTVLFTTGCVSVLRYQYQEALNQIPKDVKIKNVTNDYIEYYRVKTNKVSVEVFENDTYRAYYHTDGTIYKTTRIAK